MDVWGEAQKALEVALAPGAKFRPGQLEAIEALVGGRERVLVVQRTGWGKSIVYFIATCLLRDQGLGPTILISPLISLMRDQLRMADELGLRAVTINSSTNHDWDRIEGELVRDEVDLLLITPERLANDHFRIDTLPSIPKGIGLFVVDEAHSISDWGHDFRPDYRRIRRITESLPTSVPLLATTATANDRVVIDIESQLGPDLKLIRGELGRDSLYIQTVPLGHQAERLAWLAEYLAQVEGSGIVYTLTVADAKRVSAWLIEQGIDAPAYYGHVGDEVKRDLEDKLRSNEIKALVATIALGMGFDKPDMSFVVHFQRPGSVISYYQQIGRAGRAIDRAEVILLEGSEDEAITDSFIRGAFPPESLIEEVLDVLGGGDEMKLMELTSRINASESLIKQTLKTLEVEGIVARAGTSWVRTPNPWTPDRERIEAVTAIREGEQAKMAEFVGTDGCLMRFITHELDDPTEKDCGHCANCAGPIVTIQPDPGLVQQAVSFLKRSYRPIEPRKKWAHGLSERRGLIPPAHRLEVGRALAIYGDAGWGTLVKSGKYGGGGFSDELVEAMVEMIGEELQVEPFPTWVASVPSLRDPTLVDGFAAKLAARLGLSYRRALVKQQETAQQKTLQNGLQQARNALRAFLVDPAEVEQGPVFLFDDMVDSRWSLTVCGVLLLEHGSGPVYPLVLGQTSTGTDP
jgi:ATP-dependent DNA helicase RecQ